MRLQRLRGENFRSFASFDLELNTGSGGLVAVVGDNGAGKSTIFSAVEWALYGNQRGRSAVSVRRDGCPEEAKCWVELEFECAGYVYVARRDEANATLIDLATDETRATTLTGVSREVALLLGLDREMFCATFYARQNEVQALDSPEESKRREQLERLLGIERLRHAEAHAAASTKEQKAVVAAMAQTMPDIDALAADVQRVEAEARQAAPVQQARTQLDALTAERTKARDHVQTLRAQAEQAQARLLEAQQAKAAVGREQIIRNGFAERVAAARVASEELAVLQPVAARAEELSAREREMLLLRDNHERAATWRSRLDEAMAKAAHAADQIAALPPIADDQDPQRLAAAVTEAERLLAELGPHLTQQTAELQAAQARIRELNQTLRTARRARELDEELTRLAGAGDSVDTFTSQWHEANARRSELSAQITRDEEHREAIVSDGEHAACPRCKRSYGTDWEEILCAFDRDLDAARSEVGELDGRLEVLDEQGKAARAEAERAQQLAGERRAVGEPGDPAAIEAQIAEAERSVSAAASAQANTEKTIAALSRQLPIQREEAKRTHEKVRSHEATIAAHAQAQRDVEMFSAELGSIDSNGYDPDAHARLSSELAEAAKASQRCAALRDTAASLKLMAGRLEEQEEKLAEAQTVAQQLSEAAQAVVVDANLIHAAQADCERLDDQIDSAGVALRDAEIQATAESRAVEQARTRLAEAKKTEKTLAEARREERVRREVQDALGAYRADASRRARPTLIAEASQLLGTVTKGRYSAMQISDRYAVEVFDGQTAYPLKRFSGGEQDLAGLCVRLGLSRMVARQRGVEASFAILDEVFGSQDPRRRTLISEQLRTLLEAEFRQIFVITHTEDVLNHCDLAIHVSRGEDGISIAEGPR